VTGRAARRRFQTELKARATNGVAQTRHAWLVLQPAQLLLATLLLGKGYCAPLRRAQAGRATNS